MKLTFHREYPKGKQYDPIYVSQDGRYEIHKHYFGMGYTYDVYKEEVYKYTADTLQDARHFAQAYENSL